MIFRARATRGLRRPSLDARSRRSISPHPWGNNERAWMSKFRCFPTRPQRSHLVLLLRRAISLVKPSSPPTALSAISLGSG